MVTPQVVRRWVLTGAVAAITMTGAIYGAELKGTQELKKEKKRAKEATPEEMIAHLEATRADWVIKKNELERKMANFAERRKAEKQSQEGPK